MSTIADAGLLLYDKKGIPFERGDVVKVWHFATEHPRKTYYMYKQVRGIKMIGPEGKSPYIQFGHLNMRPEDDYDSYYLERPDGRVLAGYEIVQSIKCDHAERRRAQDHRSGEE